MPSEICSPRSQRAKAGRPPIKRLTRLLLCSAGQCSGTAISSEQCSASADSVTAWHAIVEPAVNRVLVELEELCVQPGLTLRTLGRRYGISPARLGTLFQQAVGCSFRKYLRYLRVRKALGLLAEPGKSVSEVAYDVGYRSLSGFDRDFKAILQVVPSVFRVTAQGELSESSRKRNSDNLIQLYSSTSRTIIDLRVPISVLV
jgi:AraC-like DNA-binding protein